MSKDRRKRLFRCARIGSLAIIFLGLTSTLMAKNEVCCMFAACRHYGFPSSFLSLCKVTDDYTEAKKVLRAPGLELSRDGWHFDFAGEMTSLLPGPTTSLFVDAAIALLFGWVVDAAYRKLTSSRHEKNHPRDSR